MISIDIHFAKQLHWLILACSFALGNVAVSRAQSVCLPLPRLLSISPMGGQIGTSFDVTIAAENMEEPGPLLFENPAIQATAKLDAQGKPIANQYTLAIAHDCPAGLYEARVLGRLDRKSVV
jgi:hypothetical protein